MKDVKIVANDIYFKNELVAKLVDTNYYTLQDDFLEQLDNQSEIDFESCYYDLENSLVYDDKVDEIIDCLNELKDCSKKEDGHEIIKEALACCEELKKDIEYMHDNTIKA